MEMNKLRVTLGVALAAAGPHCTVADENGPVCPDGALCVAEDALKDWYEFTDDCRCCFMAQAGTPNDPFVTCFGHLFPPSVDFCADVGTQNNANGAIYECRHPCETLAPDEEQAYGCHGDGFGNQHEDQVCVPGEVYDPGEMQPWGEPCCSLCEDWDGDGEPNYQGCCEGMRTDGQMGCEFSSCVWMCSGARCEEHGQDQSTCETNGGVWASERSCADEIARQGMVPLWMPGLPLDRAGLVWLAQHGETCCTGYQLPSFEGSCDSDVEIFVRLSVLPVLLPLALPSKLCALRRPSWLITWWRVRVRAGWVHGCGGRIKLNLAPTLSAKLG